MSEPLDQTQQLPLQGTEPSPPKPTLASLIVSDVERINTSLDSLNAHINTIAFQVFQIVAQSRFLLLAAIGLFAFLAVTLLAVLTLVAWMVGHGVR